jgi:Glycosyl transferase family 2
MSILWLGIPSDISHCSPCQRTLSSYQALKDYAIRDFGFGFPAAEAILTHVVRNKLGNQSQMPRDFWNRLVVLPVRCTLRSAQTGQTFEASTASCVAGISGEFAASEGPLRVQEVEDYAIQMREGAELGVPLYATGAVLNLLGGNSQPRSMYMMDGARRITAAALNRRREVTIWLLLIDDEYARLLDPAEVGGLRHRLSSLRWFSNYQSIPLAGLQGERSLNRFGLMEMSLLRDQVVMDFGCNTGQSCLKAVQAGAREVIGIEGMRDTWEGAVQIGELTGFQNLRYLNVDFNAPDFDALINQQSPERADYSFFFSVYRTRELVQRDRLFQYIIDKTRKGIFFEGHAHPKIDTLEYYDWLFDSFGLSHQFLGNSEGELRPLFFLDLAKAKRTASTPSTGQAALPPVPKFSAALPPQMPVPPVPSLLSRSVPPWQAAAGSPATTPKLEPVLPSKADRYRVSAMVSTYKNERFIEGRLKDLLAQTLGDQLEIIVVDSGSPENEGAIVRRYQKQHPNIHYIRTEQRENV